MAIGSGSTSSTTARRASRRLRSTQSPRRVKRPFLLKLDIQGAEVQALVGAKGVLRDTNVVICEAGHGTFSQSMST